MSWKIVVPPDRAFVEIRYVGLVTPAELQDAMRAAFRQLGELEVSRVLADCSRLEGGHTVVDLFAMVEALDGSGVANSMKEAVILPATDVMASSIRFWETACYNRGMQVRSFDDREQALAWLLEA